jgi:hypothetical protein
MGQRKTISLDTTKGMWAGGDPAIMPDGYCRKVRNMVLRPNRWEQRPPFTYDSRPSIVNLSTWHDNGAVRLVAHESDAGGGGSATYVKAASGETWGASVGLATTPVNDFTNHNGSLYFLYVSGSDESTGVASYNGTSVAFPVSEVWPDSLAAYRSRLFFGGVTLPISNVLGTAGYDPTAWTLTNVTAVNIADGSTSTGRVTPTNTTASKMSKTFTAVDNPTYVCAVRGVHPSYRVPITVSLKYASAWSAATAYTVGQVVIPVAANNLCYRATVAGTSAGAEPVWPVTTGGTVVDNGVTWICDGSDTFASTKQYVPSATDSLQFTGFVVQGLCSADAAGTMRAQIDFNHDGAAITLAPVDVSYKDGLAATVPNKAN